MIYFRFFVRDNFNIRMFRIWHALLILLNRKNGIRKMFKLEIYNFFFAKSTTCEKNRYTITAVNQK